MLATKPAKPRRPKKEWKRVELTLADWLRQKVYCGDEERGQEKCRFYTLDGRFSLSWWGYRNFCLGVIPPGKYVHYTSGYSLLEVFRGFQIKRAADLRGYYEYQVEVPVEASAPPPIPKAKPAPIAAQASLFGDLL